ncbi:hypothetical protein OKW11_005644 [Pseudomonas baetica]|nr:hypothetical protein [Pseudomonas baetica]
MWLTGRLAPDFKTIADFRKDNGKAIRSVCRQFVVLCPNLDLFSQSIIAIDGSKFKAVNNRDRNFTQGKVKAHMQQIEQSIDCYLAAMDSADRATPEVAEAKAKRLKEKIETLKQQMQKLKDIEALLHDSPDQQISLTDPDARSMATSGRGTGTLACEQAGIATFVPKPRPQAAKPKADSVSRTSSTLLHRTSIDVLRDSY